MIAYASRTGNVRDIVLRLGLPAVEVDEHTTLTEPFLLLTYTDGLGQVPPIVDRFMARNGPLCRGVAVSGNRNFGHRHFGKAGDAIAAAWRIPLVRKMELRGFQQDLEAIRQFYEREIRKESGHEVVLAAEQ